MARVDQYNSDISRWALKTKRKIKLEILSIVVSIGPGYNRQEVAVRKYHGEAAKINFAFPYYMVFMHKGAGRGYGGNITGNFYRGGGLDKNSKWKSRGKTNPLSMGRMGTGKRKPKPWFNPIVENQFPELASIIADYKGDKVVANIQKILIR